MGLWASYRGAFAPKNLYTQTDRPTDKHLALQKWINYKVATLAQRISYVEGFPDTDYALYNTRVGDTP